MGKSSDNYLQRAAEQTRGEFVAGLPFFFLVGIGAGADAARRLHGGTGAGLPRGTGTRDPADEWNETTGVFEVETEGQQPIALAVRKVQQNFPSMITLGRTANNDIVLASLNVSKFHAFFRVSGGRVELHDAGSANGTWVGDRRLRPKSEPVVVAPGAALRFADVRLRLVGPGECWDWVREQAT